MAGTPPFHIKTISQFLELRGLPKPAHPLFSIIDIQPIKEVPRDVPKILVTDLYIIGLKKFFSSKLRLTYGHQDYDFNEGILGHMAPGQVFGFDPEGQKEEMDMRGWFLLIHPDFLWNTPLAKKIKQYEFFDYAVNEALFLSDKEEQTMNNILRLIDQEYHNSIDRLSREIIITQIESLLHYSERFYRRQFVTRQISSHSIISRLEQLLATCFDNASLAANGIPTVRNISEQLNITPNYLSGLLKELTGKSTQQHIQDKVIEKAKERLAATDLSVSEIAFELGFDYPQSFSHLFKNKTNLSPLEFRRSMN